ncbi:MAG: ribonuclease III [Alphaproteobacteria bacterium]|nr:ribonuclease III [Alphaproteobacteria bacterium]
MICEKLGYNFKNKKLLEEALTLARGSHKSKYERLEFLGDRVLGLTVASFLFKQYPSELEGALSKRFSALVKEETLFKIAKKINLEAFLTHSDKKGGITPSVQADVIEALLAAVFLDSDYETAKKVILNLFEDEVSNISEIPTEAKTTLQEWVQKNKKKLPRYTIISQEGPAHAPLIRICLEVEGYENTYGEGHNKKEASIQAAEEMIKKIGLKK